MINEYGVGVKQILYDIPRFLMPLLFMGTYFLFK